MAKVGDPIQIPDLSNYKKPDGIPDAVWQQVMSAMQRALNAAQSQAHSNPDGSQKEPLDYMFNEIFPQGSDYFDYNDYDPLTRAWIQYKGNVAGDADAINTWYQQYIQYLLGEQNDARNYERSLATNQAALMQNAGMSRAAALAALQGGSATDTSQTAITPQATQMEQNRINRINNILDIFRTAAAMANQIVALASAPFDIKAKQITNTLVTNQNDMLEQQIQGMQDAAMFLQAVANQDANLEEGAKPIADMSINEQYSYFQKMSGRPFNFSTDKASSWQYAQSNPFKRAAQNPFFWATLNEQVRQKNLASASVFEPARAQQEVSRIRAAVQLVQNEAFTEAMRGKILRNDAFVAEYTAQARKDLELLKMQCQKHQYQFDDARAQAFLKRVSTFNELDFLQMDYEIGRLSAINDPAIFDQQRSALVHSLDFQVANYIYGSSIASLKNGVLQSMYERDDQGHLLPNSDLTKWTKNYLRYNELGQTSAVNASTNVARTIFSGVSATGIGAFAVYKIWSAANAARSAVTTAAAAAETTAPPLPFSSITPLVVTPPLVNMIKNQIDPLGTVYGQQPY